MVKLFLPLFTVLASLCVLIKLVLWLNLKSKKRVGFIRSFVVFFSIHDVHNASSNSSRVFRKYNNLLNSILWGSLLALAVVFVFNTGSLGNLIPTKKEKMENRIK